MTADIRVLIADDHPVYRHGLRAALADAPGVTVVGEATTGETAVERAVAYAADVVLMDLNMPDLNGIDATRALLAAAPKTAILVVTMFDNDESLFSAMRAGARGYLVKGADQQEIVRAIHAVAAGEVVFGAGIASRALAFFANAPASGRAARPFPELTDREVEVLTLIAGGANNADIARRLFLSDKTIRNNVSNIFAKLRVEDRAQAIVRARRAGLGETG